VRNSQHQKIDLDYAFRDLGEPVPPGALATEPAMSGALATESA
jgi:hypothetical protein